MSALYRKPKPRPLKPYETHLGLMETNELVVGQFACSACSKIFHYADDDNDSYPPKYCPECGRGNRDAF
jgi:hypothetical protein